MEKKLPESLMMGVELEISVNNNVDKENFIKTVMPTIGKKFAYCKTDSSIYNGFELVTHPFSWDYHKGYEKVWEKFLSLIVEKGAVENESVGIHVHLTKKSFSSMHLYKFMKFFYDKNHRKFMIEISQRSNMDKMNSYCRFDDSDTNNLKKIAKSHSNFSSNRHSAVSVMSQFTVEVRLFETRYNHRDFLKNIEFCHAVWAFTKDVSLKEMSMKDFIQFVYTNSRIYKNLWDFMLQMKNISLTGIK
jgi:hypothetical protein